MSCGVRACDRTQLRLLLVLPYVMLAIATGLAVGIDHGLAEKLLGDLGLAAPAAAWMALIHALRPQWHQRQLLMAACYVLLLALMAALVLRDPIYGFY